MKFSELLPTPSEYTNHTLLHGIKPEFRRCPKCGQVEFTFIPTRRDDHGLVGLKAPIHECGQLFQCMVYIPTDEKEKRVWERMRNGHNAD